MPSFSFLTIFFGSNNFLSLWLCISLICINLNCKRPEKNKVVQISLSDSIRQLIKGKWGEENGRAIYEVKEDSIFYFGRDSSFPYKLYGDTLFVKVPEVDSPVAWGKMSVVRDTLFIRDIYVENQTTIGFRCQ